MNVSVCIEFRGGKGHCYVTILLTDYEIVKFETSECYDYDLQPGVYDILFEGVSPSLGTKIEITDSSGNQLGKRSISREGYFSKKVTITI